VKYIRLPEPILEKAAEIEASREKRQALYTGSLSSFTNRGGSRGGRTAYRGTNTTAGGRGRGHGHFKYPLQEGKQERRDTHSTAKPFSAKSQEPYNRP
jgi:hypothetical protein